MKMPDNRFGRMLALMRTNRGLTRAQLAEAVGVRPRRIKDVECGSVLPLCAANIEAAAKRLCVPAAPLLTAAADSREAYSRQLLKEVGRVEETAP